MKIKNLSKFPFGRYAHATISIDHKIYIFGGHRTEKPSTFLNDIGFIDLSKVKFDPKDGN